MRRPASLCLLMAVSLAAGCASRGAVPRPFPGAGGADTSAPPAVVAGPEDPAPAPSAAPPAVEVPPASAGAPPIDMPAMGRLVEMALTFRGVPYRNGGSDPAGFDCSGLVQYVFARHGVPLPREVRDQFRAGTSVQRDRIQPGDLLFFETVSRGPSHVGIAIGGSEFVHAPSSRGVVRVERFTVDYWAKRWVGARRLAVTS